MRVAIVERDIKLMNLKIANLFAVLNSEISGLVGHEEFKAEIARLDKEKASVDKLNELEAAILKCGCGSQLPRTTREIERIVVRDPAPVQVATSAPANTAVPAAPAQPQQPILIPASEFTNNNDNNDDFQVTFGDMTFNFGDVVVTLPANDPDNIRDVIVVPQLTLNNYNYNFLYTYVGEDLVVGTLSGWCDEMKACLLDTSCSQNLDLLTSLAILCRWESTHLTPPPTVVLTPGPTSTPRPWSTTSPTLAPSVTPAVTPSTTTLPGTATSTRVPPTRTMEPTPTTRASATPMLPTSTPGPYCPYPLDGDEYQSTISGRAYNAIWECKRLWQMWLPDEHLRNTYFELSPSFAEGRYTYNGKLCTLYLDLNRDNVLDMTPGTIINGNNQSFTVPAGNGLSWAKAKCKGLPGTGFDVWWLDSAPPTPVPTRACTGKIYPVYDASGAELPEPYHLRWDCAMTILGNPGVNDIPGSEKLPYHSTAIELPIGNWSFKGVNAKITVNYIDGSVDVAALTNAFDFEVSGGPASIVIEDYGGVSGGIAINKRR
jgi:hypothetical protein